MAEPGRTLKVLLLTVLITVLSTPATIFLPGHLMSVQDGVFSSEMLRALGGVLLLPLLGFLVFMRFVSFGDSPYEPWLLHIGSGILLLGLVISAAGLVGFIGLRAGLFSPTTFQGSTAATLRVVGEHIGIAATSLDPIRTVYFIGYSVTLIGLAVLLLVRPDVGLGIGFVGGHVLCMAGILITVPSAILFGINLASYGIFLLGGPLFMTANPLYFWILLGGVCTLLAGLGLVEIYSAIVDHH